MMGFRLIIASSTNIISLVIWCGRTLELFNSTSAFYSLETILIKSTSRKHNADRRSGDLLSPSPPDASSSSTVTRTGTGTGATGSSLFSPSPPPPLTSCMGLRKSPPPPTAAEASWWAGNGEKGAILWLVGVARSKKLSSMFSSGKTDSAPGLCGRKQSQC